MFGLSTGGGDTIETLRLGENTVDRVREIGFVEVRPLEPKPVHKPILLLGSAAVFLMIDVDEDVVCASVPCVGDKNAEACCLTGVTFNGVKCQFCSGLRVCGLSPVYVDPVDVLEDFGVVGAVVDKVSTSELQSTFGTLLGAMLVILLKLFEVVGVCDDEEVGDILQSREPRGRLESFDVFELLELVGSFDAVVCDSVLEPSGFDLPKLESVDMSEPEIVEVLADDKPERGARSPAI